MSNATSALIITSYSKLPPSDNNGSISNLTQPAIALLAKVAACGDAAAGIYAQCNLGGSYAGANTQPKPFSKGVRTFLIRMLIALRKLLVNNVVIILCSSVTTAGSFAPLTRS